MQRFSRGQRETQHFFGVAYKKTHPVGPEHGKWVHRRLLNLCKRLGVRALAEPPLCKRLAPVLLVHAPKGRDTLDTLLDDFRGEPERTRFCSRARLVPTFCDHERATPLRARGKRLGSARTGPTQVLDEILWAPEEPAPRTKSGSVG